VIIIIIAIELLFTYMHLNYARNELYRIIYNIAESTKNKQVHEAKIAMPGPRSINMNDEEVIKLRIELENRINNIEERLKILENGEGDEQIIIERQQMDDLDDIWLFTKRYNSGEYVEDTYACKCYKPTDMRYERDENENSYKECKNDTEGLFIFRIGKKYVLVPSFHNTLTDPIVKILGIRKFYELPKEMEGKSNNRVEKFAFVNGFLHGQGRLELVGTKGSFKE